jgi:hypothetical protein
VEQTSPALPKPYTLTAGAWQLVFVPIARSASSIVVSGIVFIRTKPVEEAGNV